MRLFNLDAHISVIVDIKNIFKHLHPEMEITNWSISGHTWVLNESIDSVEVVNADTWANFDLEMIEAFQDRYDNFLKLFDGFICAFPPTLFRVNPYFVRLPTFLVLKFHTGTLI